MSARLDVTPTPANDRRLALVLWHGAIGGAESFSVTLAECLRRHDALIEVVFIGAPYPLAERLDAAGVPYRSLGFTRGRDAAWHACRFASEIIRIGPDGALLVACGFIGAALRSGGYRGPIIAVEHGAQLTLSSIPWPRRWLLRVGAVSGAWATDAEVAVSEFMLEEMRRHPHARKLQRIYNGIDPLRYSSPIASVPGAADCALVVAFAGRLITGKGADRLIEAVARIYPIHPIELLIAGDGSQRAQLESLVASSRLGQAVRFLGVQDDMPGFWRECDVAVIPSDSLAESFSMTTLESMASGKPVLATRCGAIPELVVDGVTGTLVPPGDVGALAQALLTYAQHPNLRRAHGEAGRTRATERFTIDDCAQAYLDLFTELIEVTAQSRRRLSALPGLVLADHRAKRGR